MKILRIGLGITFFWIGVLIFLHPEAWGGYMRPWAANLLPVPLEQAMLATAFLDMAIGAALLLNLYVWLIALVGAIHIAIVLIVSGINDITVRDVGLLAAALELTIDSWKKS